MLSGRLFFSALRALKRDIEHLKAEIAPLRTKYSSTKGSLTRAKNSNRQDIISEKKAAFDAAADNFLPKKHQLEEKKKQYKLLEKQLKQLDKELAYENSKLQLPAGIDSRQYPAYAEALAKTLQSELVLANDKILAAKKAELVQE